MTEPTLPPDTTVVDANGNTTNVKFVPMPGRAQTEADFDRIEAAAQKRIRKQERNRGLMIEAEMRKAKS